MATTIGNTEEYCDMSQSILNEKVHRARGGGTGRLDQDKLKATQKTLVQCCMNLVAADKATKTGKRKYTVSEKVLELAKAKLDKYRFRRPKGYKVTKPLNISEEDRERRRQAIAKGRAVYQQMLAERRKAKEEALKKEKLEKEAALKKEQQAKERAQKRAQLEKEWAEKNPKATNGYGWTLSDRRCNVPERGLKSVKFFAGYNPQLKRIQYANYNHCSLADTHALHLLDMSLDYCPSNPNMAVMLNFKFISNKLHGTKFYHSLYLDLERKREGDIQHHLPNILYLKNLINSMGGRFCKKSYWKMLNELRVACSAHTGNDSNKTIIDYMEVDRKALRWFPPAKPQGTESLEDTIQADKCRKWERFQKDLKSISKRYLGKYIRPEKQFSSVMSYRFLSESLHAVYLAPFRFFKSLERRSNHIKDIQEAIDYSITIFEQRQKAIAEKAARLNQEPEKVFPIQPGNAWTGINKSEYEIDLTDAIEELKELRKNVRSIGKVQRFRPTLEVIMAEDALFPGSIPEPKSLLDEFINDYQKILHADQLNKNPNVKADVMPNWWHRSMCSYLCRHEKYNSIPMEEKLRICDLFGHESRALFPKRLIHSMQSLRLLRNLDQLPSKVVEYINNMPVENDLPDYQGHPLYQGPINTRFLGFRCKDKAAIYDHLSNILQILFTEMAEGHCDKTPYIQQIFEAVALAVHKTFGTGKGSLYADCFKDFKNAIDHVSFIGYFTSWMKNVVSKGTSNIKWYPAYLQVCANTIRENHNNLMDEIRKAFVF